MFSCLNKTNTPFLLLKLSLALILLLAVTAAFPQSTGKAGDIPSYIQLSKSHEENHPDSAVDYCTRGLKLAETNNDLHGKALLLMQLGRINTIHHHGELARKFINKALIIFQNFHDREYTALAYNELALLDSQGSLASATVDLSQSMRIFEEMRDSAGIAATCQELGSVYEEKGETEKALAYYLHALANYQHHSPKPNDYFVLLQHISRLYAQKGNRLAALTYLDEGLRNSRDLLLQDTEISILEDEGKVMEMTGEPKNALSFYKRELDTARKYDNLGGQAKALADIAGVLKKDSSTRSLEYLKKALGIALHLQLPQLKASIYGAVADIYKQKNNYKEAMTALDEHNRLLDSLLVSKTISDIAALDTSYQLEASEEQIVELRDINKREKTIRNLGFVIVLLVLLALLSLWLYLRRIKRLNKKLNDSNQVRNKLFSILGHDLKGPAGNAVQLLEIIEKNTLPPEQQNKLLGELKKQSIAAFDLLNALFEWGKAQFEGVEVKAENIMTKPLLQKSISLLSSSAIKKDILITDHTSSATQIFADPNHFEFIIRNLLSNAIKFTKEQGRIDIHQTGSDSEVIFSVKDTGIGISPQKQAQFQKTNLPVSFGTKGEKGSGLGLLLIKEFISAGNGRIRLESKEGEGSTFYISFSKPPVAQ